jgi:hypothetical protein
MHKGFPDFFYVGLVGIATLLTGCYTPGEKAVISNDPFRLQQILDQPNHSGEDLSSLLMYTHHSDCMECLEMLIGLHVKIPTDYLAGAALSGNEKLARRYVRYGVDPNAAMTLIVVDPGHFTGGDPLRPEQVQLARTILEKLEREGTSTAAVPTSSANPVQSAPVAPTAELRAIVAPVFQQAERPNDYALVVGIEKYDDLPAATFADRDAAAATDFIHALGVPTANIVTLMDSHATKSGLAKKLEGWLANNVNENSTVYFYYSGHGAPDIKTGDAYLVPYDGDPEYLDQTGYPLKRVYEKLGNLKAKRVLVMLDSCFSGAGGRSILPKGARPLVGIVDTGTKDLDAKISVLAAADSKQISGTNDEKGHGLFSYYLFNGLNGGAKNASGQVTLDSLFAYLKPKVADEAHRRNREQVPQFMTSGTESNGLILRDK